MFAVVFSR